MSGKVTGWAFEQETGSPISKLVLVKLADNANDLGLSWPSVTRLVRQTELSERSVRDHLQKLQDLGLLRIIERRERSGRQRSNCYYLLVPWGQGKEVEEMVDDLTGIAPPDADADEGGGVQEVQGGGGTSCTVPPGVVQGPPGRPAGRGGAGGAPLIEPSLKKNRQRTVREPSASTSDAVPPPKVLKATKIGSYTPDDAARERAKVYWRRHGRPDLCLAIADVVDRFIAHHRGKGTKWESWEDCWQTWYCNQLEFTKPPRTNGHAPPGGNGNGAPFERTNEAGWKGRLEVFYGLRESAKGTWNDKWGPLPGTPEFKCPAECVEHIKLYNGGISPCV